MAEQFHKKKRQRRKKIRTLNANISFITEFQTFVYEICFSFSYSFFFLPVNSPWDTQVLKCYHWALVEFFSDLSTYRKCPPGSTDVWYIVIRAENIKFLCFFEIVSHIFQSMLLVDWYWSAHLLHWINFNSSLKVRLTMQRKKNL